MTFGESRKTFIFQKIIIHLIKKAAMGFVHAEIELISGDDLVLARRNLIGEDEVKSMNILALVDTGSIMLCINENIQEYLKFPVVETKRVQLANGQIVECHVVTNVEIRFKN